MPQGTEQLFPRDPGLALFAGNINFDTRTPGRATPAFDIVQFQTSDMLHYYVDAIETIAPLGASTGGQPRQYAGVNFTMHRLDNGTVTSDTTFADVVQGMVICDNGSGVKTLLVGFGSSSSIKNAKRSLTTDTSPWTTTNAAGGAQFWLICKAGADVYAVTDAGVAILGEYRVSKCPLGNDPTLAASWGNGLEVGTPEWAIVGLAAIGDSIVAGKPDGLYYYNDQTKRFDNVLSFLERSPHPLNGKGMKAVTNGVLYPTHDGKLYFFDGVAVQEVTPGKGQILPKDTGITRISAIADNGDYVAIVTDCWQNTTNSSSYSGAANLKAYTFIGGTWVDATSAVTDRDFTTGADMSAFGAAANDALYIGSDIPLEAVSVWVTRNVNAAVQSFTTPQYSNGTAGTVSPFNSSFTSFTAGIDGTILSVAATSLVNTGFPAAASNAVLTWTDKDAFTTNTLTAITFPAPISATVTKYWYRWKRTSSTGMTASTTIDEIEVVPARRGLPVGGALTQANNYTSRDRAGGLTHVYLGKRERTVGFTWHDVYAVDTYGGVWAMAWHNGGDGNSTNLGQILVLWGRYRRVGIVEGKTRDPARTISPGLAFFDATASTGVVANLAPGGTYLGDETRLKQVSRVLIDTRYFQPPTGSAGDTIDLFYQWDETDIQFAGTSSGGPAVIEFKDGLGQGRYLQLWAAINQGHYQRINAPEIRGVWVEYDYRSAVFEFGQDQAEGIPART